MGAQKLSEVAIGSTPSDDTHFLVTQPETVEGDTVESVRRLTKDQVAELVGSGGGSGTGLTDDIKQALLTIAEKVAYIDEDGQDYYDALYDALYPPADLVSISAVYTQSGVVYDTDTLDSLKTDLVVTAHMSDSTTRTVTAYTLSGTLEEGTSTITVSYGGKTTTFTVTVTQEPPYEFYDYIQGDGTAYIDTGLKAQIYVGSNYEHELKIAHGANESEKAVYGAREAWGNANARLIWQKNRQFSAAYCGSATGFLTDMTTESLYDPAIIKTGTDKKGSGYIAIDGGYASTPSKARIYYFKVRNSSNELIAEMIPAKRKSDDAVGMYDTVRNTFYQNARDTGTFTLGND